MQVRGLMASPEISVVLATYDRVGLLPRAVASVLAQADVDFELVIVDDASSDGTPGFLATLADPRARVITAQTNLGPSGARNRGLEAARAPAVAFLDSDDCYRSGRLSVPLAALADPAIVCVLSSALRFDRGTPREARIPDLTLRPAAFEWALICDLVPVEASSMTVRRDAALAAGGFCPALRLAEDREFLIRLARRGGVRLLSDVLWDKSWVDDSLSNDWRKAGAGLVAYLRQRPEYATRFPAIASYLATKILVSHVRDHRFDALWHDVSAFRAAGLIDSDVLRLVRRHRAVSRYRREQATADALGALPGAPEKWL
jgi:glycosyltransferase involved in cell wall biosynthesis